MQVTLTVVAVLAASSSLVVGHNNIHPSYENPVRSASEDEIKHLPGLGEPIKFKQFSGYLQGDEEGEKFLHYWFVESQREPSKDPVVLWLNGGPGCSSLSGLLTELGPFEVNNDTKTLKLRETSWNKLANVLFLESPLGVGFSYQRGGEDCQTDDTTAELNYMALKAFFTKFPHYKSSPLYLTGESYAGVYLPMLATLVDADPALNLRGLAIGNGNFNTDLSHKSLVFFAYHHGLVGKSAWRAISRECCEGRPPTPENCQLSGRNLRGKCVKAKEMVFEAALRSGVNPYNIYADCATNGNEQSLSQQTDNSLVDRALAALLLGLGGVKASKSSRTCDSSSSSDQPSTVRGLDISPTCIDGGRQTAYLNRPEVRLAINIPPETGAWRLCIRPAYFQQYARSPEGMAPQMQQLIESKRNLTILLFNGDVDAVCNFLGNEWFVEQLARPLVKDYESWMVDGQVAGWAIHYEGITYATVRGSGHMVPEDKPEVAFELFRRFLNSSNGTIYL